MPKLLGILIGILLITLVGMILLIVEECIRDHIQYRKRRNNAGKGSGQQILCDDAYVRCKTKTYKADHAWDDHSTASWMVQEAHDTAALGLQWLHDEVCRMVQEGHDTTIHDHQVAVEYHDQFVAKPDFGGCTP